MAINIVYLEHETLDGSLEATALFLECLLMIPDLRCDTQVSVGATCELDNGKWATMVCLLGNNGLEGLDALAGQCQGMVGCDPKLLWFSVS